MATRYFGLYAPPQKYILDNNRKELETIQSNVRSKAAMFESEAQRSEREMSERREQIGRHRPGRSASAPRYDPDSPYIPHPDYISGAFDDRDTPNSGYDALSVDTNVHNQQRSYYNYRSGAEHDPISPSERRIRRLEV